MKILMLTWEFPPYLTGGLGRHVAELAPALAEIGVAVHVLTPWPRAYSETAVLAPNLIVHRVSAPTVYSDQVILDQAKGVNPSLVKAAALLWAEFGGFDLIHVHDWLVGFAALTLKQQYKCPMVATIHATEKGRWRSEMLANPLSQSIDETEQQLMFEAWRVIACSNYMIHDLQRVFHLPADKLDMIPNGISLLPTPSQLHTSPLPKILRHKQDSIIFSVGRLSYEKGQQVLLGAMPNVLASFPNTKLIVAGKGPLLADLQQVTVDMKLTDQVVFVGYITDAERNQFFKAADCAVFPSLYEPFGIVALEAMVCRCPVVVSQVGGLEEVVTHQETGLLIHPDNSESTAWGILEMLTKPTQAKQYAENAYQTLQQKYSWALIAAETKKVYERVIQERVAADW